jgi:hypothetical protein
MPLYGSELADSVGSHLFIFGGGEMYDTDHEQIPFTTLDGELTDVDVGMFDVLTQLKEMGVRTQFSCQGGGIPIQDSDKKFQRLAYVVADAKSFMPVLREIKRNLRKNYYSEKSEDFARMLFRTGFSREFNLVLRRRNVEHQWSFRLNAELIRRNAYRIEDEFSNRYGHRITLRWPADVMDDFLGLLLETHMNPYSLRRRKNAIRKNSRRRE